MEATCQRCHETLREADRYCAACGLPQLLFVEADAVTEVGGGAPADVAVTMHSGSDIAWRQALQTAVLVAIPAGVLCSRMGALDWIWIMLAAVWVVRLYARRVATLRVTASVGVRIGLVMGVLTSWLVLAIHGGELWVRRYMMHQGGQIDVEIEQTLQPGIQMNQQLMTNMGMASGEVASAIQKMKAVMLSPEGRAGYILGAVLMGLAFLVFFAMVGGALGARLAPQLRRPEA